MKLESNEFININIEHREQNEKEHIKILLGLAETFEKKEQAITSLPLKGL